MIPTETESELTAICAIDHFDWLAAITALAEGGPGTAASAADLAAYVRDYDPEDPEDADGGGPGEEPDDEDEPFYLSGDEEFDDLTMEGLFLPVDLAVAGARRDRRRRAADRAGLVGPARGHAPGLGPVRRRAGLGVFRRLPRHLEVRRARR